MRSFSLAGTGCYDNRLDVRELARRSRWRSKLGEEGELCRKPWGWLALMGWSRIRARLRADKPPLWVV